MFLLLISVLHWFLSFPHVNTLLWIQLSEVDPQDNRDFHARGNGEKPPQYLNELVNSKMLISHGFLIPAQMKLEKPLLHRLSWHQLLLLRHIFCFLFCAAPALLWTDDARASWTPPAPAEAYATQKPSPPNYTDDLGTVLIVHGCQSQLPLSTSFLLRTVVQLSEQMKECFEMPHL